jgi:hypothetical protein
VLTSGERDEEMSALATICVDSSLLPGIGPLCIWAYGGWVCGTTHAG